MRENSRKKSLDINENDSNDLNENNDESEEHKNKTRNHNTLINKSRGHSDFGHQLSYNKKLENELESLPNEVSKLFRHSLDKYKFNMEVYVPHSMVISKKEYYNKNYMLNHLVKTEDIIQDKRNQIEPLSKETKKFSHQYELVRNENMSHQLKYLDKIEQIYKNKGFNTNGINYKKEDNIFTPSFLLDIKYGNNSQTDAVKYGQSTNKKEYKKDKWLLNKFDEVIQKKNQGKNDNENQMKEQPNIENEDENKKLVAQIKRDLNEKIRIQNMSRDEYYEHSKKLKNEIETIKNTINNFKDLNEYFKKKNRYRYKFNNRYNSDLNTSIDFKKNENNLLKNNNKNSSIFVSSKGMKNIPNDKSQILPEIKAYRTNTKNNIKILDKEKNKNFLKAKTNIIPKTELKSILKKNKKIETTYLSEKRIKEIQKEKKLNQLYDILINRTSNSIYPYEQVNQYFNNYSPRKIPIVNSERGSNIHGLVEEVQTIINENNFASFAKSNYNAKKDIRKKGGFINEENQFNNKILDDDYMNNLDDKIRRMHYDFTETLLSNKKDTILNE